jgi:hypothetical protein
MLVRWRGVGQEGNACRVPGATCQEVQAKSGAECHQPGTGEVNWSIGRLANPDRWDDPWPNRRVDIPSRVIQIKA